MPEKLNLSSIKPAAARKNRKRVGRGPGSGKGRYSGRGIKGQKARSGSNKMRPGFEGGQMPIYMRLGKQRGPYSKDAMPMGPHRTSTVPVNVRDLERVFDDGSEVTLEALIDKGLIKNTRTDVKILGQGDLKKKLAVTAHSFSASAREKIELAIGADRAVHVADDALAGSDLVATARALSKAVEREQPDLVLLGQQGADSDGAVLWAALADLLQLPVVSQAAGLELGEGKVTAKRQTEYGYDVIEAPLPAVVAVSDAINEPRYPSLKGIMGAKKKPFETLDAADLGLGADEVGERGSRTEVLALADPPSRGGSVRIEDDGSAAEKIVDYLADRKLI